MNSGDFMVFEYTLKTFVQGKNLINLLRTTAKSFDYGVDVMPLRETNPFLDTRWWKIFGPIVGKNFRYNGLPLKDVSPEIKSVKIFDKQYIPIKREGISKSERTTLWSVESILNEKENYYFLPIEIYQGDGFVRKRGKFTHVARAKPLETNERFIIQYYCVNKIVDRVIKFLFKRDASIFLNSSEGSS